MKRDHQGIAAWTQVQRMRLPGRLLVFHDASHWSMKGREARHYWKDPTPGWSAISRTRLEFQGTAVTNPGKSWATLFAPHY